jgi:hypothetical protein
MDIRSAVDAIGLAVDAAGMRFDLSRFARSVSHSPAYLHDSGEAFETFPGALRPYNRRS